MEEIWKDIPGFEGIYQASTEGNIRSLNFNKTGKIKELKPKIDKYGYKRIELSKNNKQQTFLVSTLVGRSFLDNIPTNARIIHIGDKTKNNIDNLKWIPIKKNTEKKETIKLNIKENLSQLARKHNITPRRLYKRLEHGWTLEEALNIPFERKKRKLNVSLYNYNGELLSVDDVEKKFNIHKKLIYKRLKAGWCIEEVIETPIAKRRMKNK